MTYQPSDIAMKLLALLRNARVLAVHRQQRPLSGDVMRACKIMAKANAFPVDQSEFDVMIKAIPGKMNTELNEMFDKIMKTVEGVDMQMQRDSGPKSSGLLTWSDLPH